MTFFGIARTARLRLGHVFHASQMVVTAETDEKPHRIDP